MQIQLYNTLTRQKEVFVPRDPQRVTMYVCGPTVYNFAHIGNARPVVVFDTLYRLLQRQYPTVVYVRNVTDVDDVLTSAARRAGSPYDSFAAVQQFYFDQDMAALGVQRVLDAVERSAATGSWTEVGG